MPATIANFIQGFEPDDTELHLVHCTTVQTGLSVMLSGALRPTMCPVYEDDLLYFFYGRPAYKPAADAEPSGMIELAPICLVLDPQLVVEATRMLPFDSGGFARYSPLMGAGLPLPHFELGADPTSPRRLIKAFYGSAHNYVHQQPQPLNPEPPLSRLAARAYQRLISDPALRPVDDRCGTIEVQLSRDVPLTEALRAIIAPQLLFDDPEIKSVLAACPEVTLMPYPTYGRFAPASLSQALYERVDRFHQALGALR